VKKYRKISGAMYTYVHAHANSALRTVTGVGGGGGGADTGNECHDTGYLNQNFNL
jgi:hypothetical protein